MTSKVYYVYILLCRDNTLYCGYTTDLGHRLAAHNAGRGAKYTKTRRPVRMVYHETFLTKSEALKREAALKKLTRSQKIDLIEAADPAEGKKIRELSVRK